VILNFKKDKSSKNKAQAAPSRDELFPVGPLN